MIYKKSSVLALSKRSEIPNLINFVSFLSLQCNSKWLRAMMMDAGVQQFRVNVRKQDLQRRTDPLRPTERLLNRIAGHVIHGHLQSIANELEICRGRYPQAVAESSSTKTHICKVKLGLQELRESILHTKPYYF